MIEYLNEDEVYRVGMCIEEAGLDFYTRMAEKADDQGTKRVFRRLARDEKEHLAFFESLEIKTARGMGSGPAEHDADVSKYVCSLVDGGIFSSLGKMEKMARGKFNAERALEQEALDTPGALPAHRRGEEPRRADLDETRESEEEEGTRG